jgi:hypothetical protein
MSGTIFSGSYSSGVTLSNPAMENPATVTGTISVAAGPAPHGAIGTAWTVVDQGTIASSAGLGAALPSGGSISTTTNAQIAGNTVGADIYGAGGSVTNEARSAPQPVPACILVWVERSSIRQTD